MASGTYNAPLGIVKQWRNITSTGKTFTIANNGRLILFTLGSSSATSGMWFVWATNSGSVAYETVNAASGITLTTDTNSLKVAPSSGSLHLAFLDFNNCLS